MFRNLFLSFFKCFKDKVKLNHHSREEVGIEELPQLASGGVDNAPTALIEVSPGHALVVLCLDMSSSPITVINSFRAFVMFA